MGKSPSSRRAWIEIVGHRHHEKRRPVALLAEGVDRNPSRPGVRCLTCWSPSSRRAWIEIIRCPRRKHCRFVALLAEGVDRNPSRPGVRCLTCVALLAEGVDRNSRFASWLGWATWSPSSRRAWIEIVRARCSNTRGSVALLAEGVDRNWTVMLAAPRYSCRPPRGGRG